MPPYDSYTSSATAPSTCPTRHTLHCGFPQANDQQQQLQQLPIPAGVCNIAPTTSVADSICAGPVPLHYPFTEHGLPPDDFHRPDALSSVTNPAQQRPHSIDIPPHLPCHSSEGVSRPDSEIRSRKRGTSARLEENEEEENRNQSAGKMDHSLIEKRYRASLNDKMAVLRECVPSLRIMSKSARGEDITEERKQLGNLILPHKLSKATVLSKATEYIQHLEKQNNRLLDEIRAMGAKLASLDRLVTTDVVNGATGPLQPLPEDIEWAHDSPAVCRFSQSSDAGQQCFAYGHHKVPYDMTQAKAIQSYLIPQQPNLACNSALV